MDETRDPLNSPIKLSDLVANIGIDLVLVLLFVMLTLVFIYVPVLNGTIIRSALGLGMILFIPGYSLIAALFPGKADIDDIERVALSFGLSVAVVPLIGLLLNFTPWGIRLDPIVVCLAIFTVLCVFIAYLRRRELAKIDRFSVDFRGAFDNVRSDIFSDRASLDKALTVILLLSVILSVVAVVYVVAMPKQGEKFTEFYILGPDGKADNYPTKYALGDTRPIIVGITDHEYASVPYELVVTLNDSTNVTRLYTEKVTLADNQTWEKPINVTPDRSGTNMEMEFLLYANENMTSPYRELHLWVNVTSRNNTGPNTP